MFSFGYFGLLALGVALFLFLRHIFYQYQVAHQQKEVYIRHCIKSGEFNEVKKGSANIATIKLQKVDDPEKAVAGKNDEYITKSVNDQCPFALCTLQVKC